MRTICSENILLFGGLNLMNKKELNEIKKNFNDDCGFFTINKVVNTIPAETSELIIATLKKTLSGSLGKQLREYSFPKDAYLEGGTQGLLYKVVDNCFIDDETTDMFINHIVEHLEYVSTYSIISASCVYSVLHKNSMGDIDEEQGADFDYKFIITAICPVELRIDGLILDDETKEVVKNVRMDRVVKMPTDGFLFPLFNDRAPDVNGVLCYSKTAKKPNVSMVNEVLGCEFVMSAENEKETFNAIVSNVIGDEIDTEVPKIDVNVMKNILWEAGVSEEKLEHLPKVFDGAVGEGGSLAAYSLVTNKTKLSAPSITVNVANSAIDKVKTQVMNGRKCIIINLDDPEVSVNGIDTTVK